MRHVFRLLETAKLQRRPVNWVLLENVRACPTCMCGGALVLLAAPLVLDNNTVASNFCILCV